MIETPNEAQSVAYERLGTLAEWSPWQPFATAVASAPRLPGVYLLQEPATQLICYVGMAGERAGSGAPSGLHGRLRVYGSGKGAVSDFGEAALDRAFADEDWVEAQLERLRASGPRRAKQWAADAIARVAPNICWATCADRLGARSLEDHVVQLLRPHGIWNR